MSEVKSRTSIFSDIFLIINNIIPLVGAILFKWDILVIIILFWAESGVIGLFNIIKMIHIGKGKEVLKYFIFVVPYGIFLFSHYFFIIVGGILAGLIGPSMINDGLFEPIWQDKRTLFVILSMFISHTVSYWRNFLRKKEYEKVTIDEQMVKPYKRIVIMQFVLLFSAFIMVFFKLDKPIIAVIILVLLKAVIDFISHKKSHVIKNVE